ncbi:hypothetical protein PDE01_08230 [Paracoccus denitrificans]|nr:hypothetical protein PDE01_08230 [Paracoccus denitrificans]
MSNDCISVRLEKLSFAPADISYSVPEVWGSNAYGEAKEEHMSVFILAQLKFTDIERYRRYQAAFAEVFGKFNGRLVTAHEAVTVLEGDWPFDKIVVLEFPSWDEAIRFESSPEYAQIAVDRKAGANAVVILAGDKA